MSEKPYKSATQMDDELAKFTDRILSGEPAEEADAEELRSLQAVVSRLKAMPSNPPPAGAMERIEKQLVAAWHRNRALQDEEPWLWQKSLQVFKSLAGQPRRSLIAAVVLIVLVLIIVLPFNQLITSNIEATAGNTSQDQVFLFIGGVVLVIGLLWFGRRKS